MKIDWEYRDGELMVGTLRFPIEEWMRYWNVGIRSKLVEEGFTHYEVQEIYKLIKWINGDNVDLGELSKRLDI